MQSFFSSFIKKWGGGGEGRQGRSFPSEGKEKAKKKAWWQTSNWCKNGQKSEKTGG